MDSAEVVGIEKSTEDNSLVSSSEDPKDRELFVRRVREYGYDIYIERTLTTLLKIILTP
jgi:hypothetical protein